MAKAKGYQSIVGWRKATTWGTAVACGALHGLEVLSIDVAGNRDIVSDMSITGTVSQREGDKGNIQVNGSIVAPLRYENFHRILAALMGTAGVPAVVDTSARRHLLKVAPTTDGIFHTLAYEILKDTTIFEFNTAKVVGVSLKITIPGRIEATARIVAHDFTDASAINTTTTIDTITQSANLEIAQARQCVIRMNAQGGAGLASTDAVFCTGLELNLERPLEADFTTEFGDRSSEPMPPSGGDPFFKVSGKLSFSQYQTGSPGQNAAFVMEQQARTLKKMDITLTGDNLAGAATQKYQWVFWLPKVVLLPGKPTIAAGAYSWEQPFTSHHVPTIPTGFTAGYTDAITIENYNADTVDPLA